MSITIRAVVIPADPEKPIHEQDIELGSNSGLDAMQKLVGGFIQVVPFRGDRIVQLVFNEEGKIVDPPLPPNRRATSEMDGYLFEGDYIAGDAVLVAYNDEGETVSVPDRIRVEDGRLIA